MPIMTDLPSRPPLSNSRYRHYKGNVYEVIELALHTENLEWMVVYRSVAEPEKVWVRPYDMFVDTVSLDDTGVPRFIKLEETI
jgi:hypothetical protein